MAEPQTKTDPLDTHLSAGEVENSDTDYQNWKERKVRRALEQADDPAQMIPAGQVWKDLGLEH